MKQNIENYTLLIKSEILCNGLKFNEFSEELARLYDPTKTKRTGNVGIHFKIGEYFVNGAMDRMYDSKNIYTNLSPYELRKIKAREEIRWLLLKNGKEVFEVELVQPPDWYQKKTLAGVQMTKLFLCEGASNLMGSISNYCCYSRNNTECKFCGLEQDHIEQFSAIDFADVILEALKEDPYSTVTITCGNTNHDDRGSRLVAEYVDVIQSMAKKSFSSNKSMSLQVECAPPKNIKYIERLIKSGVNSFSINLEIYDDNTREKICPGKSKISKKLYEETWKYVVTSLGKYRVGSALIVGLESIESSLEGARYLLNQGVLPNMLPFKPIPGSKYENNKTVDSKLYFEICSEVSNLIEEYNVDHERRLGCTTCGACSMEMDLF